MKIRFTLLLVCIALILKGNNIEFKQLNMAGIDSMNKENYASSIYLHTKALNMARADNYYSGIFLSLNNLGLNHFLITDYEKALKYYLEGFRLAVKHGELKDEMTILSNLSLVYIETKKYPKAESHLLQAIKLAEKLGNKKRIGFYLTNLGALSLEQKKYQKAKDYLLDAEEYLINEPTSLFAAKINLLRIDLEEKNYTKVIYDGEKLNKEYSESGFMRERYELQLILIKAYHGIGFNDKALELTKYLLTFSIRPQIKLECYTILSAILENNKKYQDALIYRDSMAYISNELTLSKDKKSTQNYMLQFELFKSEHELVLLKEKTKNRLYLFSILFLFSIIIVLFLFLRLRKKLKSFELVKIIKDGLIKQREKELMVEKEQVQALKGEIEQVQLFSTQKIEELTMEIEERNKKITEKVLHNNKVNENLSEILKLIELEFNKQSSTQLKSVIHQIKLLLSDESRWTDYLYNFENLNPKFIKSLQNLHKTLTPDDIRFLSYVYLNFDTKEIASALNITPDAVRKRKERLAKKLEISEISIYNYLITLSVGDLSHFVAPMSHHLSKDNATLG